MAVQVPDEVQAHRRHLADHLPPRIRSVQPRVLVHVPVSGGKGDRMSHNDEDNDNFGTRDMARGHLYHSHARHRSQQHNRNNSTTPNHHHQHHHQHQHNHHAHRNLRQHQQDGSPTSSLQSEAEQCSPVASQNSRLSTRTSASPSSSRMATPSPPALLQRNSQDFRKFSRLPIGKSDKRWGIVSRDLFKCHATGSARIDVIARFGFPLMFVCFNLAYWSMYLFSEEESKRMN